MSSQSKEQFETSRISHRLIHGQRILVKSATGRERSRLRHEAEVLSLLKLSGLVEMIEVKEEDDQTLLLLADNGPRTLLRPLDMTGEELLRSLQRCCTAVEQLHSAGWSHGALRPEHVLLGARGRPRLCSLGESQPLSHLPQREAAAAVQGDIAQLALMFDHVANVQIALMSRSDRWRWRQQARRLRQIAQASASGAQLLSASELSRAAGELKSGQIRSRRARGFSAPRKPNSAPARGLLALGLAAVAIALLFTAGFGLTASNTAPLNTAPANTAPLKTPAAKPAAGKTSIDKTPGGQAPTPPQTEAPTPVTTTCGFWPLITLELGIDINGDSCPERVVIDGQFITVGELTYQVGLPQDRLAVGDWNCDGQATALLLRPSTAELFEFSHWATPGEAAESQLVATVEQAVDLRSEPQPRSAETNKKSCDRVVVTLQDGSLVYPPIQLAEAKK